MAIMSDAVTIASPYLLTRGLPLGKDHLGVSPGFVAK